MAFTGLVLMLLGFLFAVLETFYFNPVWFPKRLPMSYNEFTCDFISSLISGGGGSLVIYAIFINASNEIKN